METTAGSRNPLTLLFTNKLFILVLRVFLGAMFIYSSIHKIAEPNAFAISVRGFQMLPVSLTNIFALFVAWTEMIAGIMMLVGIMTRKAAGALLILLAMFTIAITSTIVRGLVVDCGCFSNEGGSHTDWQLIVRNIFLITATLMVMFYDRGMLSVSSLFGKSRA